MAAGHMKTLFDELSGQFLECSICRNPFDENVHTPRYYPCAHTTCQQCMTHQFQQSSTYEHEIRCPLCMREYLAPFPDVSYYEKNNILRDLKDFISTKKKEEFCDKCPNQFSDAYCKDCDSSLCRSCSEAIHIGNNSNHNVICGIKKQDLPIDACNECRAQSDIYCPTCKVFLCYSCRDVHHSDETIGNHEVLKVNENNALALEMGDSFLQTISISMRRAIQTINERCQPPIWNVLALWQDILVIASSVFLLAMVILLGVYIYSFPAFIILPSEEVEPVNIICRHRTKEEVYQDRGTSQGQLFRTLCTFNVFHYDLLNRNKIYFAIDIDINIAKTYQDGRDGKLFAIKTFHLHKEQNTHHKQRNMYWSVSRCSTMKDELALCLENVVYRRDYRVSQKIISTVKTGQNKTVTFLFFVDNEKKLMEIFSPAVLWKDVVFLEHYYESKTLSVWISLADSKNDKYVTARIRSGANITIGDLSPSAIEIIFGLFTYPFRCFYH